MHRNFAAIDFTKTNWKIRSIWLQARRKFSNWKHTRKILCVWKSATWFHCSGDALPTSNEIIFAELQILYVALFNNPCWIECLCFKFCRSMHHGKAHSIQFKICTKIKRGKFLFFRFDVMRKFLFSRDMFSSIDFIIYIDMIRRQGF